MNLSEIDMIWCDQNNVSYDQFKKVAELFDNDKVKEEWKKILNYGNGNEGSNSNPLVKQEKEQELLNEKISKQDINFMFETMTKEAKHDKISIKQLFYGMASGLTKIVLHSNVNSKNAGAGKSYLLTLVSDYFPSKYVLILTGASDKAFQHKEGIMVLEDKNTGELTQVEQIINKLRLDIVDIEQKIEDEKSKGKKYKLLIKELRQQKLEKLRNGRISLEN